ncbi:FMN-binding split barrel-containing protein [Dioscorea alata]|uniref:FMN-binding split barrel-containing protein n=1 Tax=Dioscorea alata TaxID=55571 RepID=A0ACB7V3B7_DIOAL|nr:FMN-binding split barrel-containing protein [Dioscorea alata]
MGFATKKGFFIKPVRHFSEHLACIAEMRQLKGSSKAVALSVAERCKNILASNWQAHLNTIKADSKGSKEDIYTSKVHYMLRRGRPYIWIPEGELHNTFSARVALTGDLIALKEEKVHRVAESLRESILMEYNLANQASYTVSALLSSAGASCRSRCENFLEILGESDKYAVYKFDINSCTYIDGSGRAHDLDNEEITAPKADEISLFTEKLIDGINQSQARRRALMLFCFEYHNTSARDALMLSIDQKGFDILAKVPEVDSNQNQQYNWKEFRFTFKEEASDIESFCRLLVELEEEALESVKSYSGLG